MSMGPRALALPGIFALLCTSGLAFGQSLPATTQVQLKDPGTVLQATDAWTNWHTYWTSRTVVCAAPCTAVVPRDGTYRVVGDDMPPSSPFRLPEGEEVLLKVHRGNPGAHDGGALFLVLGGITALIGTMLLVGNADKSRELAGVITLAGGGAMMGLGLPMLLSNGTTIEFN
jgi:hypothetical protein